MALKERPKSSARRWGAPALGLISVSVAPAEPPGEDLKEMSHLGLTKCPLFRTGGPGEWI